MPASEMCLQVHAGLMLLICSAFRLSLTCAQAQLPSLTAMYSPTYSIHTLAGILLHSCSALHAAAQRGPLRLLQLLLAHKAEVGLADAKGWTPLHLAARAGNAPKVQCLLEAGAKVADVNSQGNTPLHLVSTALPVTGDSLCDEDVTVGM